MSTNRAIAFVFALAATAASVTSLALPAPDEAEGSAQVLLAIKGMTCGGCVAAVKGALSKLDGVQSYEVTLEKNEAEVRFDPSRTDPEKIAQAVSKTGFKATVKGGKGGSEGK